MQSYFQGIVSTKENLGKFNVIQQIRVQSLKVGMIIQYMYTCLSMLLNKHCFEKSGQKTPWLYFYIEIHNHE